MTGAAVYLTGGEDPVDINITNWKAYFCQAGVNVQDTHEGIEISSGEAVMVDYGVLADLDEAVPSGQDEDKPLLKVTNNHFNVHVAGVHVTDVRDYNIANNDFLFQGAGAKIGIWSEARSMGHALRRHQRKQVRRVQFVRLGDRRLAPGVLSRRHDGRPRRP